MTKRLKCMGGLFLMAVGGAVIGLGQWLYWAGKPLYLDNRKSRK